MSENEIAKDFIQKHVKEIDVWQNDYLTLRWEVAMDYDLNLATAASVVEKIQHILNDG